MCSTNSSVCKQDGWTWISALQENNLVVFSNSLVQIWNYVRNFSLNKRLTAVWADQVTSATGRQAANWCSDILRPRCKLAATARPSSLTLSTCGCQYSSCWVWAAVLLILEKKVGLVRYIRAGSRANVSAMAAWIRPRTSLTEETRQTPWPNKHRGSNQDSGIITASHVGEVLNHL